MLLQIIPALLSTLTLALSAAVRTPRDEDLPTAPIVYDNPQDVLYAVTLFDQPKTTVRGWVTAWAPPNGVGVRLHADFWNFPDNGPYPYHIYVDQIPTEEANCQKAGGHLDPYDRGSKPPCNERYPQTCQVGDLSGKHSPIYVAPDDPFEVEYTDLFLSTDPANPAFIGNRSIVVHAPDGTRLNCGNFVKAKH